MNVKLLRKVKRHILAEPKRLKMWSWIYRRHKWQPKVERNDSSHLTRSFARCGTAACIAGWTCILSKKKEEGAVSIMETAANLLGLNAQEAHKLFGPLAWPSQFYRTDLDAGTKEVAKTTADRIEHFIKTKGRE